MRRRRRRSLPLRSILWTLLAANVAAGLWFSPLTVMRQIRVEGIPSALQPNVSEILHSAADAPCVRVPARLLESRIQALPGVRSADIRRNVFGVATLKVTRLTPAARVQGRPGLYLSDRGEFFRTQDAPRELPAVIPPDEYGGPILAIASGWESRSAAKACLLAVEKGFSSSETDGATVIRVEAGGSISMLCPEGALVEFGGANELVEKFTKLKELRVRNPKLLRDNSHINLVSPSRATYIPKSRQQ